MHTDNIPANAIKVTYQYYGQAVGFIYVWPSGDNWQWSALANNGEAGTMEMAIKEARAWVKGY